MRRLRPATRTSVRCLQRVQDRRLCSAVPWGRPGGAWRHRHRHGWGYSSTIRHLKPEDARGIANRRRHRVGVAKYLAGRRTEGLSSDLRQNLSDYGDGLVNLLLGKQLSRSADGLLRNVPCPQVRTANADRRIQGLLRSGLSKPEGGDQGTGVRFQRRRHGGSKLQPYVLWLLLCDVASFISGGFLPPRLVSFDWRWPDQLDF